jgi:hypothetical protein
MWQLKKSSLVFESSFDTDKILNFRFQLQGSPPHS